MSAPNSIGRIRMGEATVLSTMSGTPWECATAASSATSQTLPAGLPTVSQYTAMVFSSIRRSMSAGASDAAKRTVMPERGSTCENKVWVVPYNCGTETMLRPISAKQSMALCKAACPELRHSAPTPPSSAAMRRSSTATVGLLMRL